MTVLVVNTYNALKSLAVTRLLIAINVINAVPVVLSQPKIPPPLKQALIYS